jgi:hypothetical protein
MNNDEAVNGLDTDPFASYLIDHTLPCDYDDDYPGLWGSALYHADCNCDGSINGLDLDAYVLRLTDPNDYCDTYEGCELCPVCGQDGGGDGFGGGSAAEVAEHFETYLTDAHLAVLMDYIDELIDEFADTPRGDFWSAVREELN